MVDLDDASAIAALDPDGALDDVEAAPAQWDAAAGLVTAPLDLRGADGVVIVGVGGSGITGDVVAAIAEGAGFGLPVQAIKGYRLPPWVSSATLVLCVSASGATEETREVHGAAAAIGSRIVAVTGGGPLAEEVAAAGGRVIDIPTGPQPRHSLGSLAVPCLALLGLAGDVRAAAEALADVVAANGRTMPAVDNPAKSRAVVLARSPHATCWGSGPLGTVAAYRLRCQLAENAELPGSHGEVPELCHNDVVGLTAAHAASFSTLVRVRDRAGEHPREALRVDLLADQLADRFAAALDIDAGKGPPLVRVARVVGTVDLTSIWTALARGVDPTPIAPIQAIKAALAAQEDPVG